MSGQDAAGDLRPSADPPFLVVGIGASAGGLESLENFFANVRPDSGLAFVVIQHLSPDFKSMMDELLARRTAIPIRRAEEGMDVKPDHIYLLPPKKEMIVSGGRLHLTDKDPKQGLTLPIDHFFRSLAQDCGNRAVAVILSGTGSDGSRGIKDVHKVGGLVICEDENTAKFNGMPLSAQATGVVDMVLSAKDMPAALMRHAGGEAGPESTPEPAVPLEGIEAVFELLRREYDIDFSHYKPATVGRRIERRLTMASAGNLDGYVERLRGDSDELNSLYKDLLIGVTQFFRDAEPFAVMEGQAVPDLLERVGKEEELRVWVAGCATGEEAYSLAILLHEALEKADRPVNLKVFATDVHKGSLEQAGHGTYDEERLAAVTPERLKRYFNKRHGRYQVSQDLRQLIVFARHNVIKDAPFTNLHLITCRNLLIYLQPKAQRKALSLFHFGLKAGGVLLLGNSETPGSLADEFDTVNEHCKLYRKKRDVRLPAEMRLPISNSDGPGRNVPAVPTAAGTPPDIALVRVYDRLLDKYMPPSLLVNDRRELVESFGGAEKLLSVKGRRPSRDLLDMLRTDAKTTIAGALNRAMKHDQPVSFAGVRLAIDGGEQPFRLGVEPVEDARTARRHYLITLEPLNDPAPPAAKSGDLDLDEVSLDHVRHLEDELRYTKENLQATIEELETSNEELQATNEEMVASNEELQSANEELHSVNEELYSVNAEHQRKITELAELNQDMEHLLRATDVATLFLDGELRVRRFTPQIAKVFDLVEQDVGRRIGTFAHRIKHDFLLNDLRDVLQDGEPRECEVRDADGRVYFLRVLPYRGGESRIDGVVLSMIDISVLEEARGQIAHLSAIVESSEDSIIGIDLDGTVESWNAGAERLYGYTAEEAIGRSVTMLLPQGQEAVDVQGWLGGLERGEHFDPIEADRLTKDGRKVHVSLTLSPVKNAAGRVIGASGISRDITARRQAVEALKEEARLREQFLAMLSHELRNPLNAVQVAAQVLAVPGLPDKDDAATREVISRQADQMSRLLDDLLDVSRVTQGKIRLSRSGIDLREAARDAAEAARPLSEECGVPIDLDLPDRPVPIDGDAARLSQVAANLLTNAVKFSTRGGRVRLTLTAEGGKAYLRVADDGAGLAPDMVRKVFDMFVQADVTIDRTRGGMGVGLTLARRLVELHGGTVTARSEGRGKGSEFEVRLPLAGAAAGEVAGVSPAERNGGDAIRRIVIVEDQQENRDLLGRLLQAAGYEVFKACDGTEGVDLVRREEPDAAVIDIGLPGIDGYEVARRVRSAGLDGVRLVAFTGYGQPKDVEAAFAAGFDFHLVKPLQLAKLFEALGGHVGGNGK